MSNEKQIKSRIVMKHDTEAKWDIAGDKGFVPKNGEIIIYDVDDSHNSPRIKIGDGNNNVNELPFFVDETKADKSELLNVNGTLKNDVLPEGYPYKDVGEIVPETTIPIDQTFYEAAMGTINYEFELYIGNSYIVNYNGAEYNCEAKSLVIENVEVVALGNVGVMDSSGKTEFTNEPFVIVNLSASLASALGCYGAIMPLDGAEEVTFSICGNIIKKISKDFLPNIPNINNIVDGSRLGSVRTILTSDIIGDGAHAEGRLTTASGNASHAEGDGVTASGISSHAEGWSIHNAFDFITEEFTNEEIITAWNDNDFTLAFGQGAHAEGADTLALGEYSHAEGEKTMASGRVSHVEGNGSIASGDYAHAEGWSTASGNWSHAEGRWTTASGNWSHAEGEDTIASGNASHAEGMWTEAIGDDSHAEGYITLAQGSRSHAEGSGAEARGEASHAEGKDTNAVGENSHAEGEKTYAFGHGAHVEGYYEFTPINWRLSTTDPERKVWTYGQLGTATVDDYVLHQGAYLKIISIDTSTKTITLSGSAPGNSINDVVFSYYGKIGAYGDYSHAEGSDTNAIGPYSHAEGWQSEAIGTASHTEGHNSKAKGQYSHAEGLSTIASGHTSHAEGTLTEAGSSDSHAEGWGRHAVGESSHAEGEQNTPVGWRIKEPDSNKKIWKYDSLGLAVIGDLIRYEGRIYKIEQIDKENKTITLSRSIDTTTTNIAVQFFGKEGAFGWASHAEGLHTGALGDGCHAEGNFTVADSYYTHAEGTETKAQGPAAHAEGARTTAFGNSSHAEGSDTLSYGVASHAEGDESKAIGNHSHAEGFSTQSNGEDSHTEGYSTIADGINSHAENDRTQATGASSHAEGIQTKAAGKASHAEGILTLATGENSHAEGYYTNAQGLQSHAEGQGQRTELLKVDTTDEPKKYYYYGDNEYLFAEVGNTVSSEVSGVTTTVTSIDIENKFIYTQDDLFPAPHEIQTETLIKVALFEGKASGEGAHSEGYCTVASARGAHSEGGQTDASGDRSHAEGGQTTASGLNAHAEGWQTLASGNDSHAEGNWTKATASYSHAEGYLTEATGTASHVEGYRSYAKGIHSHAEGEFTTAEGLASHAEGYSAFAKGLYSHAEGCSAVAEGAYSHAEGWSSKAKGTSSHAEGTGTTANGHASHAEGRNTEANGDDSHAEGWFSTATGVRSHAEGYGAEAIGDNSHAEGYDTEANGANSHAEGHGSEANGINSHAEGYHTIAKEFASHAEGDCSSANGYASHAEGSYTKANGLYSHAEGDSTIAQGVYSHAEGLNTKANGDGSHTEGRSTIARGASSHAEGINKEPDEHLYISSTSGDSTVYSVDGNPWTSCVVVDKDGEFNYGFKLESDGYYKSQNFGIKESYALSQVQLDMVKSGKIYIHVRVDCESNDNIFFSKLDTPFTASATYENVTQARRYGRDQFTTVEYNVPAGKHTIDIKYRKDANGDAGKDQAEFRILSYTLNEAYIGRILSYNNKQAKIINVNTSTNTITLNESLSQTAFSSKEVTILSSGALEEASHTEGYSTVACQYSHAEGEKTVASGRTSHAEGNNTRAAGANSHSEGFETRALGEGAHVEGYRTYATGAYSHVEGRYNEIDQKGDYAHIVGIGTSPSDRRNGHTVDWKGNGTYAGMVTANGGLALASGTGYGQDIPEDTDEGRIFFMPDNTKDWIVEFGKKQTGSDPLITNWYYERYESGLVKMWGKLSFNKLPSNWGAVDSASGASVYGTTLTQNLPITLSNKISETVNISNDSNFIRLALRKTNTEESTTKTNTYALGAYGTVTGTLAFTINYFVLGEE